MQDNKTLLLWTFSTDSAFYYHPDSGLRARQGLLSLWGNKLQKQAWTTTMDSSHIEAVAQEQHSLWKTYYRRMKDSKWLILVSILVVVIGSVFYRY